ncbi:hypothetical protein BDV29DRAFT_179818 [Aspergillus leporis]|uniref:Uncharacterized protein n=1 Tax=Aspergillus leporis TaxID=41062 RepID=A0A5N5WRC2_9EURO|nr:hypothetical protein BDV29DRAFT_179818 [Aspergillus leporis]
MNAWRGKLIFNWRIPKHGKVSLCFHIYLCWTKFSFQVILLSKRNLGRLRVRWRAVRVYSISNGGITQFVFHSYLLASFASWGGVDKILCPDRIGPCAIINRSYCR